MLKEDKKTAKIEMIKKKIETNLLFNTYYTDTHYKVIRKSEQQCVIRLCSSILTLVPSREVVPTVVLLVGRVILRFVSRRWRHSPRLQRLRTLSQSQQRQGWTRTTTSTTSGSISSLSVVSVPVMV